MQFTVRNPVAGTSSGIVCRQCDLYLERSYDNRKTYHFHQYVKQSFTLHDEPSFVDGLYKELPCAPDEGRYLKKAGYEKQRLNLQKR